MSFIPPYDGGVLINHFFWEKDDEDDDLHFFFQGQLKDNNPNAVWNIEPGGPDPSTGQISFSKSIELDNSSSNDEFDIWAFGGVLKFWQVPPPMGGTIGVEINATIDKATHQSGSIDPDFWGVSHVDLRQIMRFYARVLTPTKPIGRLRIGQQPSFSSFTLDPSVPSVQLPVFDYSDDNKHEHNWSNDGNAWTPGLGPGVTKNFDFGGNVGGWQGAGSWVVIEVGIIYNNQFNAGNEKVTSSVLERVKINRITPYALQFGGL